MCHDSNLKKELLTLAWPVAYQNHEAMTSSQPCPEWLSKQYISTTASVISWLSFSDIFANPIKHFQIIQWMDLLMDSDSVWYFAIHISWSDISKHWTGTGNQLYLCSLNLIERTAPGSLPLTQSHLFETEKG